MEIRAVLEEAGLTKGEIEVYLAIIKGGSVPVGKIKEEAKLHRTTIYDFIEKLLNKGLINYAIKNNVKYFSANHPDKLLDFIKEKEENVKEILPLLIRLFESKKEEIRVEVCRGAEGFKMVLNDILKTRQNLVGFGIDETKFKEKFPILIERYFRKEEQLGIKERLLTSKDTKFIFDKKTTHYRFIPKEYFNPTPTLVYGNKVVILIWEPLTVIMIESPEIADSYKKYFEMLWGFADKSPNEEIKKIKIKRRKSKIS